MVAITALGFNDLIDTIFVNIIKIKFHSFMKNRTNLNKKGRIEF